MKEAPYNWDVRPLSDVVDILDRKRIPVNAKERQQREGVIPYYGATGQVGWIDDYLFDEELVLLGEDGAPFLDFSKQKAYIVRGKSWVNNHAHVLKSRNGLPNSYIKYYLDTIDYRPFVTGTTRLKLNQAAMKKIPVPIAPGNYPRRIVEEIEKQFSRLDEAVTNLKRVKANLKRYKASVLQAAVTGKLTEAWRKQNPDVEPASKLLKRILTERRQTWEETELAKLRAKGKDPKNDKWKEKYKEPAAPDTSDFPDLPNGWNWASLESVSEAIGGYAFKSKDFSEAGHQVVKMANIKMAKLDLSKKPSFITDVDENIVEKYRLIDGDVLITLTGTRNKRDYGYIVQVKNPEVSILLNQRIARLRPIQRSSSDFLTLVLQSEGFRNRFFNHETGNVGQGNVGVKAVTIEPILFPPFEEQQMIMLEVESKLSVAEELERIVDVNLRRSERLRQSILKQAFSGKLV